MANARRRGELGKRLTRRARGPEDGRRIMRRVGKCRAGRTCKATTHNAVMLAWAGQQSPRLHGIPEDLAIRNSSAYPTNSPLARHPCI